MCPRFLVPRIRKISGKGEKLIKRIRLIWVLVIAVSCVGFWGIGAAPAAYAEDKPAAVPGQLANVTTDPSAIDKPLPVHDTDSGTTTAADDSSTSEPADNGATAPADNSSTSKPADSGATAPADNSSTSKPADSVATAPADNTSTSKPADSGATAPADNSSTSKPADSVATAPNDNTSTSKPADSGATAPVVKAPSNKPVDGGATTPVEKAPVNRPTDGRVIAPVVKTPATKSTNVEIITPVVKVPVSEPVDNGVNDPVVKTPQTNSPSEPTLPPVQNALYNDNSNPVSNAVQGALQTIQEKIGSTVNNLAQNNAEPFITYRVRLGESLWLIGKSLGVEWEKIMAFNKLLSTIIYPDQKLNVPGLNIVDGKIQYNIKDKDTLYWIGQSLGINYLDIMSLNKLKDSWIYPDHNLTISIPLSQSGTGQVQTMSLVSQAPYTGKITSNLELLARTVYAEARGEIFDGQVAVAAVILNRLADPAFPKTIQDIIFQPYAFTAVNDGQINLTPDRVAYTAAARALEGNDPSDGALFYWNPKLATSKWIWTKPITKIIGNHVFAK